MLARLIPVLTWRHSGLGMLQAYIREGATDELRAHIWHPVLRREGIEESGLLHDHRFDLLSDVLIGHIRQVEYELTPPTETGVLQLHEVVHARAAAGGKHAPNDGLVTALPQRYGAITREIHVPEGWTYSFPKRAFHGTYPEGLTITLVEKSDQEEIAARILAPYGKPVVHAFADPLPEAAWQPVLAEAVEALGKQWSTR